MSRLARFSLILIILPVWALAENLDCAKTKNNVEHLICGNPKLPELDSALGKIYQDVLSKASDRQKSHIIADQEHWLMFTRNACETETCLKHAYWSRQAALGNYFEPHFSLLYPHESEKVEAIQKVLSTASLYSSHDAPFCAQIFYDLKQMKDIRFIDPVVQVQSYEDPALDPWKKQCRSAPPFNFSYQCERNIVPADADDVLDACKVGYGLPPFKLYELPPVDTAGEKRYFFYSDDAYGPMNRNWREPSLGGGFAGFQQIDITRCLSVAGNHWEDGGKKLTAWIGALADAGQGGRNGNNYNSIIEYKNQYYFLILHEVRNSYWLDIEQTVRAAPPTICRWSPVKR